ATSHNEWPPNDFLNDTSWNDYVKKNDNKGFVHISKMQLRCDPATGRLADRAPAYHEEGRGVTHYPAPHLDCFGGVLPVPVPLDQIPLLGDFYEHEGELYRGPNFQNGFSAEVSEGGDCVTYRNAIAVRITWPGRLGSWLLMHRDSPFIWMEAKTK